MSEQVNTSNPQIEPTSKEQEKTFVGKQRDNGVTKHEEDEAKQRGNRATKLVECVGKQRGNGATKRTEDIYFIDGLAYCKRCNTPKEIRLERPIARVVSCMCDCEEKAREDEQRKTADRERKSYIDRLRTNGIQDKNLIANSFENDKYPKSTYSAFCKDYVRDWQKHYENNTGLVFWGDVGTGKSFYASSIANALINQGVPVLVTSLIAIIGEVQGMREGKESYLAELDKYKLLVIDDFGAERQTDYAIEQVFYVIDRRYRTRKPLIITTNLTMDTLKNPSDTRQRRIYDRVIEMCIPVLFEGESIRASKQAEKIEIARSIRKGASE